MKAKRKARVVEIDFRNAGSAGRFMMTRQRAYYATAGILLLGTIYYVVTHYSVPLPFGR